MSETPVSENEEQVAADASAEAPETNSNEEETPVSEVPASEAAVVETAEVDAAAADTSAAVEQAESPAELAADDEEAEEVETTLYRVVVREDEQVIDGRIEAVDKAKEISIETGQSVLVERTDGRVKMNFRDGALIDYVLETRKGRRA